MHTPKANVAADLYRPCLWVCLPPHAQCADAAVSEDDSSQLHMLSLKTIRTTLLSHHNLLASQVVLSICMLAVELAAEPGREGQISQVG